MSNTLVKNILKTLEKNGFEAYLVGGVVRDSILGKTSNDIDIATNALPTDLLNIFGPPSKRIEYGSYNIKQKGLNIDITTYRVDMDYVNRRPSHITYSCNLLEDAKRRDFTMNAIYENRLGKRIDPYDGIIHIKERKIVSIGDPFIKLREDPLRILRAIRFASTFNMSLNETLERAILEEKNNILTLSKDRIRSELESIFLMNGFAILKEYGIDKVLNLNLDNIVYVPDIAGIWVQIDNYLDYPLEKKLKNTIKILHNILKCDTITMRDIYDYGLYNCLVCADILKIPRREIEKMNKHLPIKTRSDLKISAHIIKKVTNCQDKDINNYLTTLENKVLNGDIRNKRKELIGALERL